MKKLQKALKEFCLDKSIIKLLLPVGKIIMFIGCGFLFLGILPFFKDLFMIGSFLEIWKTTFYAGALLVFLKGDYKLLSIGFLIRTITIIILLIFMNNRFIYFIYYILSIVITGYIAYISYKQK